MCIIHNFQSMKKIFFSITFLTVFFANGVQAGNYPENAIGRILIQVEKNGEAWYVNPVDWKRYYLGRPSDAFEVMRTLGLGAKHDFIAGNEIFPKRLSGRILLDVEQNGEAYYIYPLDLKKYYLGRPSDAFRIMREKGLGIATANLMNIPLGEISGNLNSEDEKKAVKILFDVPFVSQAPFGDWSDQRQQDGCEEASSLMAMKWVRGENLSKEEGLNQILGISDFEKDKYKEFRDISSENVVQWIFEDYFEYKNAVQKKGITVDDIIEELQNGNLVITPMNGQLLGNPHFTPPGPIRHMLLIRGYDSERDVFITNDPGTRYGEAYEYKTKVIFDAIRDYPTGYHEYIKEIEKNMIVIFKL